MQLITWKELIEGTLIIAAVYYLIVFVTYYRKELRVLIRGRSRAEDLSGGTRPDDMPATRGEPEKKD